MSHELVNKTILKEKTEITIGYEVLDFNTLYSSLWTVHTTPF